MLSLFVLICIGAVLAPLCSAQLDACNEGQKRCIFLPNDCDKDAASCQQIATIDVKDGKVNVELILKDANITNQYVALGLSEDQAMGNDAVFHCINDQNTAKALLTWNHPAHFNDDSVDQSLLASQKAWIDKDTMHCQMTIDRQFTLAGDKFELDQKPYYLLLANGPVAQGHPRKHFKTPKISAEPSLF